MSIGRREKILQHLDKAVLRFATRKLGGIGPAIAYQPLPWVGLHESRRAVGTRQRGDAILAYLDSRSIDPEVTLDIGANWGYFSMIFAERGALAYAVESEPLNVRIAGIASNVAVESPGCFVPIRMLCDVDSVERLPSSSVTLCLSIWHHWVRHYGLEQATQILESLIRKTADVLFFDSGEGEMPDYYGLPFGGEDSGEWLQKYLSGLTNVDRVECLGTFEAFMPESDETKGNVKRHLFAVSTHD